MQYTVTDGHKMTRTQKTHTQSDVLRNQVHAALIVDIKLKVRQSFNRQTRQVETTAGLVTSQARFDQGTETTGSPTGSRVYS